MSDPPERRAPKPPKTKARLERLITQWQKDSGKPVSLLNLRIAAMMLAGALARVTEPDGDGIFAIKGGVAMELRMGDRARATRDVDLIMQKNEYLVPDGCLPSSSLIYLAWRWNPQWQLVSG